MQPLDSFPAFYGTRRFITAQNIRSETGIYIPCGAFPVAFSQPFLCEVLPTVGFKFTSSLWLGLYLTSSLRQPSHNLCYWDKWAYFNQAVRPFQQKGIGVANTP
jgi:hypothetical protein